MGSLAGMDLRGLSPENVATLLSGATNLRQLNQSQQQHEDLMGYRGQTSMQAQINAMLEMVKEKRLQEKALAESQAVTYGSPIEMNGKLYQRKSIGGTDAGLEEIGSATQKGPFDKFVRPDGKIEYLKEGEKVPDGWQPLSSRDPLLQALTQSNLDRQETERQQTLAAYRNAIDTGKVENGSLNAKEIANYVELYNAMSPNDQYVAEQTDATWYNPATWGGGVSYKRVPKSQGTAAPTTPQPAPQIQPQPQAPQQQGQQGQGQYPTPQTQEEFDALPVGTIYVDPDDGKLYRK